MNAIDHDPTLLDPTALGFQVLALSEIEEDPNQPRKFFEDAALEALARSIEDTAAGSATPWLHGLLHPIVVTQSPAWREGCDGAPYRLLVGARRYRAYRRRGWPVIPVRIVEAPASPARRLMTQMNENDARVNTTLWEDATAVASAFAGWMIEHPKGRAREFAIAHGRSSAWVSQHLWIAKADGITRQALQEDLIRHGEVARLFTRLSVDEQRALLLEARAEETPINRTQVLRVLQKRESHDDVREGGAPSSPAIAPSERALPCEAPLHDPDGSLHSEAYELSGGKVALVFEPAQLRFLLRRLGSEEPESDRQLAAALHRALVSAMNQ